MEHYFTSVKLLVSAIGGMIITLLGGMDSMFTLLLFLIGTDFFTGFMKAVSEKNLDPNKMFMGGIKKIMILVVIFVAFQLEKGFGTNLNLRGISITYYVITEAISIFANIAVFTTVPPEITKYLKGFNNKK